LHTNLPRVLPPETRHIQLRRLFRGSRQLLTRLSHLKSIFDYFRVQTGVKVNACNRAMSQTAVVKTYPL
jgi:hypothetical protein